MVVHSVGWVKTDEPQGRRREGPIVEATGSKIQAIGEYWTCFWRWRRLRIWFRHRAYWRYRIWSRNSGFTARIWNWSWMWSWFGFWVRCGKRDCIWWESQILECWQTLSPPGGCSSAERYW